MDRKAAIAAYKERKTVAGIYAIRCLATGEAWVGRAPDLDSIWRCLSFEFSAGSRRTAGLQAAWNAHGAEGLSFEVLEKVDEEIDYVRDKLLKSQLDHWTATLGATPV
ncbi:GIY-YIG nuclease family protein [Sphingoaurantiacus capsulatus]|uniref:GIY-YIG nuclease family protein n=1 Tax=Sphingoaurantiacus capsulatus TaxID=1771310 RepID=A0ABV7XA64_9SPHN